MNIFKSLVTAAVVVAAYHFLLGPRVYVADPVAPLERAKEMVLQGKMTEDGFKGLLREMEGTIAGKCPPWRHSVVLVKKGVLAGGEEIDLGKLLTKGRGDEVSGDKDASRDTRKAEGGHGDVDGGKRAKR